jgi:hypothetical protein
MNRITWPALLLALLAGCLPARRLRPVNQVADEPGAPVGINLLQPASDYIPPSPPRPPERLPPPEAVATPPNLAGNPYNPTPTFNNQAPNPAANPPVPALASSRLTPQPAPAGPPPTSARFGPDLAVDVEPPVSQRPAVRSSVSATADATPSANRAPAEKLRRPVAGGSRVSAGPTVRVVNGKRLRLGFQVRSTGTDPVPVELWYTRDGRAWQRDDGPPQLRSPYVMEVQEEGVYGLSLIPCNGGPKAPLPQTGDPPQFWVLVDWTRPTVTVLGVEPDLRKKALTVRWSAADDHLAPRPITLSYAEQPGGPWLPLAANLKNTGSFWGPLPPAMPPRFFFRVEAADQGGNVGEARTLTPVVLDPSPPPNKVQILGVGFDED